MADGRTKGVKQSQGSDAVFSDKGKPRHLVEKVWEREAVRALPAIKTRFNLSGLRSVTGQGRRHFSKRLAIPALLYMPDSLTFYPGTTLEISLGGIRVSVPYTGNTKEFLVGSLMSVAFTLPGSGKSTTMQCVVRHARLGPGRVLIIGASFLITLDFGNFLSLQDYFARRRGGR